MLLNEKLFRSQLARRVSTDNLAESMMAFNTNYLDTGLFGIYATGMVIPLASSDLNLFYWTLF